MEWTPEAIAAITNGRAAGKSYGQIANELGATKNMVLAKSRRLRLPPPPPTENLSNQPSRYPPWDAETSARFAHEWTTRDDISRGDVARAFGVSEDVARNRAAAMCLRRPPYRQQKRTKPVVVDRPLSLRPRLRTVPPAPKLVFVAPVVAPPLSRDGVPLVFLPRPPRACCWPMWGHKEAPTHVYCDAPTDRTYCEEHCAIAYEGRVRRGTEFVFAGLR